MSEFIDLAGGLWHYWMCIALMMLGLYIVIARENLVKKMMGLNMFQVAVIMFYVSMAKVRGGTAPIIPGYEAPHGDGHGDHGPTGHATDAAGHATDAAGHATETGHQAVAAGHEAAAAGHEIAAEILFSNPLPHVLMLTAIVVGVATTAVGLALIVRIHEAYGTVEEDEIVAKDLDAEPALR